MDITFLTPETEIFPTAEIFLLQSYIYHLAGEPEISARLLSKVLSDFVAYYIDFTDVARVCVVSGEYEKAFDFLERAYSEGGEGILLFNVDPEFAVLKNHPRFNGLLAKMNIPNPPSAPK